MTPKQKKAVSIRMKKYWAERYAKEAGTEKTATFTSNNSKVIAAMHRAMDIPHLSPTDPINRPAHYTAGEIECIDYMEDVLTPAEFIGYLRGCIIKYNHRLLLKGTAAKDAGKMRWYVTRLETALLKQEIACG